MAALSAVVTIGGRPERSVRVAHVVLVLTAIAVLAWLLVLPLLAIFAEAFRQGAAFYLDAIRQPDTLAAVRLTLTVAAIAVPLNLVFGLAAAWSMTHFQFRGKALLGALIDLPFSVSPVVAGMMLILIYGKYGWLGPWLEARGLQVIFALPGLVLATVFVTLPFVARELIPLMQAQGSEQEEAALTLGANGWQIFFRVTLPRVRWALLYGVLLCNARAMGEFGAVYVVSGHLRGLTNTLPLQVDQLYDENFSAAFAVASLLALLTVFTLGIKRLLEWRQSGGLHAGH
ncbi:sulfate ABC transporter permease subunit CysW [Dyella caseinilytica]|uniref:Sulfate ABC transporter permease subunit CysW n=1 Tax=Dyella caseinilytica TaxID=1849581 RepID=A0ABX7GUP8_9GAMM|nr:sulfate ABC transporter permease subunit CysW [Dyella caseinilytica]QRN54175.1 sulfate ABC transporter permease subunit CysW [Dyella caseinilytica]GFZ92121.1 sulfate ABC transporter permease subunit CysW [Dyella caseinilytica]